MRRKSGIYYLFCCHHRVFSMAPQRLLSCEIDKFQVPLCKVVSHGGHPFLVTPCTNLDRQFCWGKAYKNRYTVFNTVGDQNQSARCTATWCSRPWLAPTSSTISWWACFQQGSRLSDCERDKSFWKPRRGASSMVAKILEGQLSFYA